LDKLRHELMLYEEREQKLAAEKFESSLKLSILEKKHEIDQMIKKKNKIST
jgi:transcription termination factor NusB